MHQSYHKHSNLQISRMYHKKTFFFHLTRLYMPRLMQQLPARQTPVHSIIQGFTDCFSRYKPAARHLCRAAIKNEQSVFSG